MESLATAGNEFTGTFTYRVIYIGLYIGLYIWLSGSSGLYLCPVQPLQYEHIHCRRPFFKVIRVTRATRATRAIRVIDLIRDASNHQRT